MLVALGFLTRLPVGRHGQGDLGAAAWAFPLVGAVLGLAVGTVGVGASLVLPVLVAAALAVLAEVMLTGALHLDGLADCADGCGGTDRVERLRIMKDHAVGVYGTAAVVLDLVLRTALVHAVLVSLPGWAALLMLAVAWAVSRAAVLPLARWLPTARPAGTGAHLTRGLSRGGVVGALAVLVAVAAVATLVVHLVDGPSTAGPAGSAGPLLAPALALLGGVLGAALVGRWARRTLGGVTGDVLGAGAEVALLGALVGVLLGVAQPGA